MPIELNHKNVRDLAKNLREKVGRDDIKHSEVISAIAASVGRRPDAMMHELKNEKAGVPSSETRLEVFRMGEAAGFHIFFNEAGENCLTAELVTSVDENSLLRVLIYAGSASSRTTDVAASERAWTVDLELVEHSSVARLSSVGDGSLPLSSALKIGREMAAARLDLWRQHTDTPAKTAVPPISRVRANAKTLAEANGFGLWDTGGGCQAFGMVLREAETPDGDVATLEAMITTGQGCSVDAVPDEPVWQAGVSYTDPRGGDSVRITEETLTLEEAIAQALEFAREADQLWEENYDSDAIVEYEGRRLR